MFFTLVWKVFYPTLVPKSWFFFLDKEYIKEKTSREELVDEVKPSVEEREMYFTFQNLQSSGKYSNMDLDCDWQNGNREIF